MSATLSDRELRFLDLISDGMTSGEIARELFLSERTVKNYTSQLVKRLGARNRTHAVRVAVETGVLVISPGDKRAQLTTACAALRTLLRSVAEVDVDELAATTADLLGRLAHEAKIAGGRRG